MPLRQPLRCATSRSCGPGKSSRPASSRQLNREIGRSVLFVEQNIDMIRSMAQRCDVMDKERIVDQVAPEQLADDDVVRRYLAV